MSPILGSSTIRLGRRAPDRSGVWVVGPVLEDSAASTIVAQESAAAEDEGEGEKGGTS
jgi:hypothetical protein